MRNQNQINIRIQQLEKKATKKYIEQANWLEVIDTLSDREVKEYQKLVGENI